jgi:hypothetical protein
MARIARIKALSEIEADMLITEIIMGWLLETGESIAAWTHFHQCGTTDAFARIAACY